MKILLLISLLANVSLARDARPVYDVPLSDEQAGQVVEESCDYKVKTQGTKEQICSETLRMIKENAGDTFSALDSQEEIAACSEANEFNAIAHTYYVGTDGRKTLTQTHIKISGTRSCESKFRRVFAHYQVSDDGRVEYVPARIKAYETTCE